MEATSQLQGNNKLSRFERRESILASSLMVFAERGYHASTIEELARAAEVSKALIYEHFHSKQDLFLALIERNTMELLERLASAAVIGMPADQRLSAGIDAFLIFVEERRDGWRMFFGETADADVTDSLQQAQAQVTSAVAALISAEPPARDDDPVERNKEIEVLATLLTGAVQSLANWWQDHPDIQRSYLAHRIMDFAWIGLERLAAGEQWPR